MKRRLLLARGLINKPRILILDEPSIGLDPQAKHLVWQVLSKLKDEGVTQLLCTQNMEEAATLCDRVTIMHLGKVLTQDSPQALVARYVGDEVLEIEVNSGSRDGIIEVLTSGGFDFADAGTTIQVFHSSRDKLAGALVNFPERLRERRATLEDVFFGLTGRALNE